MVFDEPDFSYGPQGPAREKDVLLRGSRHSNDPIRATMPGPLMPVNRLLPDHPARVYLEGRGYDVSCLHERFRVCYCAESFLRYATATNRIIVPVYQGGEVYGWQARYIGQTDWKQVPKYYSMPGMKKSALLYNIDSACQFPLVVVCEGTSDVWRVGPQAVALFGKTISQTQQQLLATHWGKGAVVTLLDGDAQDDAQQVYDALRGKVSRLVRVALPPGYDPGDMAQDQIDEAITRAAREQGVELPRVAPGSPS